jgi:tetratricopeptide (TPR) repeat protein
MPLVATVAVAVALGGALIAAPAVADDRTACALLDSGADAAIAACTRLIDSGLIAGRALAFAYNGRGVAWRRKGDTERAMADYDEAVRLDPTFGHPYSNRGNIHLDAGRYERAIADYDQAIRHDPATAFIYHANRGKALSELRDYDGAVADYDRAILQQPRYAIAHNGRAWALFKAGRFAEALESSEQALKLNPADAPSFDTRGHIREALGDLDGALADYRAALAINSRLIESHEGMARIGRKMSDSPTRP